jgi:hypothetical protein
LFLLFLALFFAFIIQLPLGAGKDVNIQVPGSH